MDLESEINFKQQQCSQNCIFCNIEKLNIIYNKICVGIYKKPSSSKKVSNNVKGVVVPPPPPETSQNWVFAAYMISQKLFIIET